jgi:type IV secretion system protein VirB8
MAEIRDKELKEYFKKANRWEKDELERARFSKRFAWCIAVVSLFGCILSLLILACLFPLKSIEPFLIRVDNTTGLVETLSSLKDAPIYLDDAMARYFLAKYVRARESFLEDMQEINDNIISTMSTQFVEETYIREMKEKEKKRSKIFLDILSVQLIHPGLASVRYRELIEEDDRIKKEYFIATLVYQLLPKADLSFQQRLINPVAFVVKEYRRDPEVLE